MSNILEESKYIENIGKEAFPIAIAEGGNYIVIDLKKEKSIYFWDHEDPENMIKLASDIYESLNNLAPFDTESVELEEGQVESVWIDPDFLKSLKSGFHVRTTDSSVFLLVLLIFHDFLPDDIQKSSGKIKSLLVFPNFQQSLIKISQNLKFQTQQPRQSTDSDFKRYLDYLLHHRRRRQTSSGVLPFRF